MSTVLILGGGVAGMSAAHELGERGFKVTVLEYQPHYVGGKARSINVPYSSINGSIPLPGEHGFRFFPGFYKHVTDTMSRIPFKDPVTGKMNTDGVRGNLVNVARCLIARYDNPPLYALTEFPSSKEDLMTIAYDLAVLYHESEHDMDKEQADKHMQDTGIFADIEFFTERLWQIVTSCKERRNNEYERIGWWEFMDANNRSELYQTLLVSGLTRSLVAAQPKFDNTKTCGDILLQLIYNVANPFIGADRVLNGPTNDAWLNPWYEYLTKELGVNYQHGCTVTNLNADKARLKLESVSYTQNNKELTMTADYIISAIPVERIANLIQKNPDLPYMDPTLNALVSLAENVQWMNGIQYYLNVDLEITDGHILMVDTPWAITAISQIQFWKYFDIEKTYDGSVKGLLSVDVSDWHTEVELKAEDGTIVCKSASECTPKEIIDEVWHQIKTSLNYKREFITDDMLVTSYLDRDIHFTNGKSSDQEPLLINRVGTWGLRPESYTNIPNLFLASDYVKTNTDIATMEAANEAARRAVNNIIVNSGVDKPLCKIWELHEPWIMAPLRRHDKARYEKGLAWKSFLPWYDKILLAIVKFIFKILKKFV